MKFPWNRYEEKGCSKRNTLQIFITNSCNLNCSGCFAKAVIENSNEHISVEEYEKTIKDFIGKGGKQINMLGGEPLTHPRLDKLISINKSFGLKTTIYTNGYLLDRYSKEDFDDVKLRVSLYCKSGKVKSIDSLPKTKIPFDVCYMISKNTNVNELLESATHLEKNYNCGVFFISSIRELNNENEEFFEDTDLSMNVLDYKKLVHEFLNEYNGNMGIHISKRGVFESTKNLPETKCNFANYFIGGKIIQCPYDVVNLKYQNDYSFGVRHCQHNNTCLMSKIILNMTWKKPVVYVPINPFEKKEIESR